MQRWTRIPLSVIVDQIAHAASFDEILEGYPDLEEMTFNRRFEYVAWLTEEEIHIVRIQVQKRK